MPGHRTKWNVAVGITTLFLLILAVVRTAREPRFDGRPAGEWLDEALLNQQNLAKYGAIFQKAGDAGVRYLVRQLPLEPSQWKRVLVSLHNSYGTRIGLKYLPPDPYADRRMVARKLLGYFEERAAPELIRLLNASSPSVRAEAIITMSGLGPAAASVLGPRLVPGLKDPSPTITYETITTLAAIGYDPKTVVPLLVPFLHRSNRRIRVEASYALGSYPPMPELTLEPLIAALQDSDVVVRANAARALGAMGSNAAPALEPLEKQLVGVGLPSARAVEAIALIANGNPAQAGEIYKNVHAGHIAGKDHFNRMMVLRASQRFNWPLEGFEESGKTLLDSPSNWQVWEAVDAIGELDPRPDWVLPLLDRATRHPNALVRAKARIAINRRLDDSHAP